MLNRTLIVYIINLWVSYRNKSYDLHYRFKHTTDVISKLRLISKEFTATIIPLIDWDKIEIKTEKDMEILNKLFNPKPKLDNIYLSCLEEIVTKYPSWIIYLSETERNQEFRYPITANQLINMDRLKSLRWEYAINNYIDNYSSNTLKKLKYIVEDYGIITDLSDITMNFKKLVKLEISSGYRNVIKNFNSLGQLEHLKKVSLNSVTCNIGSFIELLERKECTIKTIKLENSRFNQASELPDFNVVENQREHYDNILDALSRNSYLKTFSIYNFILPVPFSKQNLIQFLNGNNTLTNLKLAPCQIIVDDSIIYKPITNTTLKYFNHMWHNDILGQILLNEWIGPSAIMNPSYSLTNNLPLISKGNHPNINSFYFDGSKDYLNNLIDILKPIYKGIDNVILYIEDNDMVAEVLEILKEYLPSNNEISAFELIGNILEISKYLIQLNHPSIKDLSLGFNPIDQDIAINLLKSFCTNSNHIQNISPRFELNSLNLPELIDTITEIIEKNHNIYSIDLFLRVPKDSIIDTTNLNQSYERFEKTVSKFYHYLDLINILIDRGPIGCHQKDMDLLNPFVNILSKYSILYNIKYKVM
ncbi:hypothetical protein DLAC_02199 [Tieghemostelium lacteum]|uniref:Uncharacterized protein n=1 Tax=Tieghemostelium lacteum TaxID=361077 RepID=A0A152A4E7_TIELA|nr:hypothetical protein DLAC_02199 [Tieghemostelium lacteum]|eukprot:KYR01099.1 hypothetical protein DLAC_02199 [Tieghemostelium lacteum]